MQQVVAALPRADDVRAHTGPAADLADAEQDLGHSAAGIPPGCAEQTLHDSDGQKIGEITSLYIHGDTGEASWMAVDTGGLLSSMVSLVAVRGATRSDHGVAVPYEKSLVDDAPSFRPDAEISHDEARELFEHYSVAADEGARQPAGHDVSGPTR